MLQLPRLLWHRLRHLLMEAAIARPEAPQRTRGALLVHVLQAGGRSLRTKSRARVWTRKRRLDSKSVKDDCADEDSTCGEPRNASGRCVKYSVAFCLNPALSGCESVSLPRSSDVRPVNASPDPASSARAVTNGRWKIL